MIKSTKTSKISAVFLAAVLTAGIIALSSPSFMTDAVAYPYNNNDNDHKDKFKFKHSFDKKSSAQYNKCVNINVNIPGLDITTGDITDDLTASSLRDGPNGGNNGPNGPDGISFDKNQVFVCINNNDNRITGGVDGGGEVDTCEEIEDCFTDRGQTIPVPFTIDGLPGLPDAPIANVDEYCAYIENNVNNFQQLQAVVEETIAGASDAVQLAVAICIADIVGINVPGGTTG